jgi:hypothetical protein
MILTKLQIFISMLLLLFCAALVFATPPRTISYQGYLTDNNGVPVTEKAKPIGFALYSTASGSVPLWSESQDVKVIRGIYSVELGSSIPLHLPFDTRYYLGVTVPPDPEMTPRQPLTNVPYAIRAGCIPGDMLSCYTGPTETLGIGVCKSGIRTCGDDGVAFGPCVGEILPSRELRDSKDNDCNGLIDDGAPFCNPGESYPCGSSVGACHPGAAICNAEGTALGTCVGAIGPTTEICDGIDNDCNGVTDDNIVLPVMPYGIYYCANGHINFSCDPGHASCIASGTCDVNTGYDPNNCGSCGSVCSLPNSTPSCFVGFCRINTCNAGFADCNQIPADGCEVNTQSDVNHCGDCSTVCAQGSVCSNGVCLKLAGAACGLNSECTSGYCTDGVCCESACNGTCEKCNQAGRSGFCDPLPAGTNPDNDCTAQSVTTCGLTGYCSGSRSCAYYPNGVVASPPSCTGNMLTQLSTCNGTGSVNQGSVVSCSPYVCNGPTSCKASCAGDVDCGSGYYCNGSLTCLAKLASGSTCASNNQCISGTCVAGAGNCQ